MRILLLVLGLLPAAFAGAQVLLVPADAEDPADLVFNPRFIQRNGIASMTGTTHIKRDGEPMYQRPERLHFRFDEQGRTVYRNTSHGRPGSGTDTSYVLFEFGTHRHPAREFRNDLSGHFALEHELDSLDRPVRSTYTRIENLGTDRYHPIPGERTEIGDERYRYDQPNDSTLRRTYLNDLGLKYREEWRIGNGDGYLVLIEDRYTVSGRRSRTTFRYDEQGRLAERTERPDLDKPTSKRRTFLYDQAGNLLETDLWHDDRQVSHEEFLYEADTFFLKARIRKDLGTGTIHVVRFTTERR